MGKMTGEELQQLRDAARWKAEQGEDTGVISHLHDVGLQQALSDDSQTDNP